MTTSKIYKGLCGVLRLRDKCVAATNKGSMQVTYSLTVNGKQLPAGDYTVKWDGAGPNVEPTSCAKNVVATAPARMIDLDQSPEP